MLEIPQWAKVGNMICGKPDMLVSPFMERLCLAFLNNSKRKTAALYAEDIETAVIMFA